MRESEREMGKMSHRVRTAKFRQVHAKGKPQSLLSFPWLVGVILLNSLIIQPIALGQADRDALPSEVNYVAIEVVHNGTGEGDTLVARLEQCTEATITVSLTQSNNVASSAPLPLTVEANGRRQFKLVTLRPADTGQAWRYQFHYDYQPGVRSDKKTSSYPYALPYAGARFKVSQGFAGKFTHLAGTPGEYAVDWGMPEGTSVLAARAGEVISLRNDVGRNTYDPKAETKVSFDEHNPRFFTNFVIIKHDDGTLGRYRHFKKGGVLVSLGQKVKAGEMIGLSGNTGFSRGPHLHFEVFCVIDGATWRTIPFQFKIPTGEVITLEEGKTY